MIKSHLFNFSENISKWETPNLGSDRSTQHEAEAPDPETLRKQARDAGYAEGYALGLQQAEGEMTKKVQALEALLHSLATPFEDVNQQTIDSLARLAGKIARCLVKRELRSEPETIMALVRDTVSILNGSAEKISIHLHPDDAALIQTITRSSAEKSRWKLIDDPLVARGDCRVVSRDSLVDGTLQSRINTIITQFQGDERG